MATNHGSFFQSVWGRRLVGVVVLIVVFSLGNSYSNQSGSYDSKSYDYDYDVTPVSSMMEADYDDGYYDYEESAGSAAISVEDSSEQKVIKTASLEVDVKSTTMTMESISDISSSYGGFVSSSYTWLQSDETTAGSIIFRVDSEYFETALEAVKALATVVSSESISGEDVTEEFVDMQSRLNNLEAEEAQYLVILEQAYTVEDLLNVSDYLSEVREDIEVIEGRLKYLEDRTDFSTITVSVYEEASIIAPSSDWKPVVVIKEAVNGLIGLVQELVDTLIYVVVFGVPLLVGVWLGRGIWRKVSKR
jgi:hypothetical protein